MRYWFDTEFIEDGKTIDLLSIGIVAEDGRELYKCNKEADLSRASDWVKANVFPFLPMRLTSDGISFEWDADPSVCLAVTIRRNILDFIGDDKPEFWAYYADYDWVALCQLFGTMMDLPKGWPMYCRDIKQWCDQIGNPKLPEQGKNEHHALADARWNKQAWDFLNEQHAAALRAERERALEEAAILAESWAHRKPVYQLPEAIRALAQKGDR